MYHGLSVKPIDNDDSYHITVDDFRSQIEYLSSNNFKTISLQDLLMFKNGLKPSLPDKPVLITFDDGFYSLYRFAMPILLEFGFNPILFLTSGFVHSVDLEIDIEEFDIEVAKDDRPLQWNELIEMTSNGWDIQSPTSTHPIMSDLNLQETINEYESSKMLIEKELKLKVDYFAYPYGNYSRLTVNTIKDLGVKLAFSVHPGKMTRLSPKYRLPRIEINSSDSMHVFINKVENGYPNSNEMLKGGFRRLLFRSALIKDFIHSLFPHYVN